MLGREIAGQHQAAGGELARRFRPARARGGKPAARSAAARPASSGGLRFQLEPLAGDPVGDPERPAADHPVAPAAAEIFEAGRHDRGRRMGQHHREREEGPLELDQDLVAAGQVAAGRLAACGRRAPRRRRGSAAAARPGWGRRGGSAVRRRPWTSRGVSGRPSWKARPGRSRRRSRMPSAERSTAAARCGISRPLSSSLQQGLERPSKPRRDGR